VEIVAVLGAVGGAGATTIAAHLSAALSLQKRNTLVFDWCADNLLRLHFGMSLNDRMGWATCLLDKADWYTAAYRSSNNVDFVPFGQLHNDGELDRLTSWLKDQPSWFRNQLNKLNLPPDTIVVCDCPRMPAALRDQVLSVADAVLLVTSPDSVSYTKTTHMVARIEAIAHAQPNAAPETLLLLNGFDSSRRLDRDISVLLRTQHKNRLSPVLIHRDESLREALACKQTVFEFAPSSQAAHDFATLATWTLARLGHQQELAK
jgi:cellulose synthase operon protein YhjQ